jgi:hypothetical protein
MLRSATLAALVLALLQPVPVEASDACVAPPLDERAAALARTDHAVSGNRFVGGCGPLLGGVVDVALGGAPAWVLPDPTDRGRSWLIVLEDGTVELVVAEPGAVPAISPIRLAPLPAGEPPLAAALGQEQVVVGSALAAASWFSDPIPGTRVTEIDGALVALTRPTDRYPHAALGDGLEAAAVEVRDAGGLVVRIEITEPEVIEGTSAMVVDLAAGGRAAGLLVTVSDAEDGARLRLYDLDGEVVAESDPIGQGFRWLHQVGAGPAGPAGETELVVVRTPHIGGVVEAYRLDGDRLERVAAQPGYRSHVIGSDNLDMALLADVDGDGRAEIVVPSQDLGSLGVLARTAHGFEELSRLALDGELATNVAATATADGGIVIAAATSDGRLRIFR